jgi:peptidyl-prolyl cis-trans isomerase B (cyclophilin B)
MTRRLALIVAIALVPAALARGAPADEEFPSVDPPGFPDPASIPDVEALVTVKDYGEFRIRFHREAAPNHVAHFLTLVATGAYDGMSFHRVIPRFIIQIGDPNSRDEDLHNDGPGGPDYRLPPEPNDLTHRRGTVSMARRGEDPASGGSQWFICLEDLPALDERATVFGEVSAGMDTVDRISQVTTRRNWNPRRRVIVEKIELVDRAEPAPPADEAPSLEGQDGATAERNAAEGDQDDEDQVVVPR